MILAMYLLTSYDKFNCMPANNNDNKEEKVYRHIFNSGVENRIIFNEKQDFEIFYGYLKDYLSTPVDPESAKKDFVVDGRVYRGIPHQPKNFFNKVELIAFSLKPNSFHLVVREITKGSLESFIRSLSTRYSIFYNKKYQRNGTLFAGPYKSVQIDNMSHLLLLTRYLHQTGKYSSYPEYLGKRKTSWVKPIISLSFLEKKGGNYQNFVEKYELNQMEREIVEKISIEKVSQPLNQPPKEEKIHLNPIIATKPKPYEFIVISAVFLLLFGLGINNIRAKMIKGPEILSTPTTSEVLSETDNNDEVKTNTDIDQTESQDKTPITYITIKISDESEYVNIRQNPTTKSEAIGKALDGDTFKFVSLNSGWYEIKLDNGSIGFVSANYATQEEILE